MKNFNFNLGIPSLIPEWKNFFSKKDFFGDLIAAMTVACAAIPLSLAIALASGVPPLTGIITAIIAGIVCALFGGSTLGVSGPAAVMTLLLANIVSKHGIQSLALIGLLTGLMQLISGITGLGKLARYIPIPVIAGFTAGMGILIFIGQMPSAFGLPSPSSSNIFISFEHLGSYIHAINGSCLFIFMFTLSLILGLPKLIFKIPSILIAVILSSAIVSLFKLDNVPLLGHIPLSLPTIHFPTLSQINLEILFSAFTIFLLASLETFFSASAMDKLTQGEKYQPNQELIGQGLGNIIVAFFAGIPISGLINRSALNFKAGAKTRRASLLHAFIILLAVYFLSSLISKIPVAALAAVLVSITISMVSYKDLYHLWNSSKTESFIYATTLFTIIFVDLIAGIQAGIIAASLILLWKAANSYTIISADKHKNILRFSLTGSLTFLSTNKILEFEDTLKNAKKGQTVLLDLSDITEIDTSGIDAVCDLYEFCQQQQIHFYLKGLAKKFEPIFRAGRGKAFIDKNYVIFDHGLENTNAVSSRARLIHGLHRFYLERKHKDKRLFEYLANKQNPHTLFITCADSRITPTQITATDPGELFIIRNAGNYIPLYQDQQVYSETAAIEFALTSFNITDIIICGHANCGAIKACKDPENIPLDTKLYHWIHLIRSQLLNHLQLEVNDLARIHLTNQVNHLKQYPIVKEKLAKSTLNIHAWFFDLHLMYEWDPVSNHFQSLLNEIEFVTP